jgi:hypothetical protein
MGTEFLFSQVNILLHTNMKVSLSLLYWGQTQGFMPPRQGLYHLNHMSSPFPSGYFGDRILFLPRQVWTMILLFYPSSSSWDDRCVPPCIAFFC